MSMDSVEIQEIAVSVLAISFAFSVGGRGLSAINDPVFWLMFFITFVTVGLGFILHELAHRQVAKSYGAYAIYKAWLPGLILMIVLALSPSPILFAAPGAVYIYSNYITRKENGIISLAGPVTNLALAIVFWLMMLVIPGEGGVLNLARTAFGIGFKINLFLGLFNMIPIFPLDGSKVWDWDKRLWVAFMVVAGGLYLFF